MKKITFLAFFQHLGGHLPLLAPIFFLSRAVLKTGDINLSENVGCESPPGGGAGVFSASTLIA